MGRMTRFRAPAPPYLGPAAHTSAGSNMPVKRIVLHSTVSPTRDGAARATAAYFRSLASGGSAHYVVDTKEVVQVVYDGVIAWHAPPNANSLGIEMCDMPSETNVARWDDAPHRAMLDLTVDLVADLCLAYSVPPWYVGKAGLLLGRRGITDHAEVSQAWHQSDHWDVGAFPRRRFMRAVRAAVKTKRKAAKSKGKSR